VPVHRPPNRLFASNVRSGWMKARCRSMAIHPRRCKSARARAFLRRVEQVDVRAGAQFGHFVQNARVRAPLQPPRARVPLQRAIEAPLQPHPVAQRRDARFSRSAPWRPAADSAGLVQERSDRSVPLRESERLGPSRGSASPARSRAAEAREGDSHLLAGVIRGILVVSSRGAPGPPR